MGESLVGLNVGIEIGYGHSYQMENLP